MLVEISTTTRSEEIRGVETCDVHISRRDVEKRQFKSPLGLGVTAARVKVFDDYSGKWCWFVVDVQIDENGNPVARVMAIGQEEYKPIDTVGTWRSP